MCFIGMLYLVSLTYNFLTPFFTVYCAAVSETIRVSNNLLSI